MVLGPVEKDGQGAQRLSNSEASGLRPQLIEALGEYFEWADDLIWLTAKKTTGKRAADWHIWSDMDPQEIGTLADIWIRAGTRSAVVAVSLRSTLEIWRYVRIGAVIGPRFWATFQFYAEQGGIGFGIPTVAA